MIELSKSKGITPVIAIVLLLLITVGAVGVVYTQFNSIISGNSAQSQVNSLQRAQKASYSMVAVKNTTNSTYGVTLKNTGDVVYNLSKESTLKIGVNGAAPVAVTARGGTDCGSKFGTLQPGSTAYCDTNVTWEDTYENDGKSTVFQLMIGNTEKASYTCTETTATYC